MTDRAIPFSAPMVVAMVEGRKSETRRVLASQHARLRHEPGDRLWVQEPWRTLATFDGDTAGDLLTQCLDAGYRKGWAPVRFVATGTSVNWREGLKPGRYRRARYMPRWLSRLTLRVTMVGVEQLHDITDTGALAEGVVWSPEWHGYVVPGVAHPNKDFPVLSRTTPREMYAALWDVLHGSGAWLRNPLVSVTKFSVHHHNIDMQEAA